MAAKPPVFTGFPFSTGYHKAQSVPEAGENKVDADSIS
jgi:hypothetical protein